MSSDSHEVGKAEVRSKMPEELPLIGADGKVVKDADGKTLMVKTRSRSRSPVRPRRP